MDDLVIVQKIQKQLRSMYQNVGDSMLSGGVDNMENTSIC